MRKTLSAWRRMSSSPMYTTHSRPNRAQIVAVATPCWPAPVSAMMRRLPMRRASSACPTVLLILWAPVWLRSSRLSQTGAPMRSDSRGAVLSGVGRPTYSRSMRVEFGAERRIGHGRVERRVERVERWHQRLGHVASAEPAESVPHLRCDCS
jgi:hypothetical protein